MPKAIHTKNLKLIIIPATMLLLTITAGFILSSSSSHAETSSATASVTVPDTCYMSSTSTTHTGTASGGTYTTNFGGESTVTVTCNDRNGYSVYAVGYSNDIEGTNGLIGTSTGLVIPTGTSTSGDVSNWAMKLTPGTGTFAPTVLSDANGSFANYHVVPTTATKVATLTSDINVSNSSQFKTSYAVAVAPTQAADTYVGKVKYTVVHPNYTNADGTLETYNIPVTFAGTGVSSVTFEATGYPTRTVSTSGSTANLTAGVQYTVTATIASGYEFVSWALNDSSYGTLGSTSTNPTTFTPNANSVSAEITITGVKPKLWFQNATSADCGETMYDNRGTDTYKNIAYSTASIGGLCWMTRNLDLPGGTTLSSSDTNLSTGFTLPASSTSGFNSYNTDYVHNSGRTTCSSNPSTGSCYSYYSFYAATAHWGTTSASSGSSSVDICPKGWRLPTQAELTTLKNTYTTGATLTKSPFLGVYAGYYNNSSFSSGVSLGYYWSSTAGNSGSAYVLRFDSSGASVNNYLRNNGYAIRCVAKS